MKSKESFALKYRPRVMDDLIGQEHIIKQITGMIAKQEIVQTMLLTGPSGIGKTTLARLIARYVNCLDLDVKKMRPCGACFSCKRSSPSDTHEMNMAESRGIDDVRDLISKASYAPQTNLRVFILDEMHQITPQAQQALLKPLEEPPSQTIWILCTTNPEKFPETILQRCRIFQFKPLDSDMCVGLLKRVCEKEGASIGDEHLASIASLAQNAPRRALKALESVIDYCNSAPVSKKELSKLIPDIVKTVIQIPPIKSVARYLFGVYNGKYSQALLSLESVTSEPDYFLHLVIEHHRAVMYRQFSDKLHAIVKPDYNLFFKEMDLLEYQFDTSPRPMADAVVEMVSTASQLKQYTVDAKFLMLALTARIVSLFGKGASK